MDFNSAGNVRVGTPTNRNRFISGEDNDFDAAVIEGIGQFNQHMPILDLPKQSFHLHVTLSKSQGSNGAQQRRQYMKFMSETGHSPSGSSAVGGWLT